MVMLTGIHAPSLRVPRESVLGMKDFALAASLAQAAGRPCLRSGTSRSSAWTATRGRPASRQPFRRRVDCQQAVGVRVEQEQGVAGFLKQRPGPNL